MSFGTRRLSVRLQAARGIAYCQALVLGLIAVFALGILAIGGAGFTLSGIASHASLDGSAVVTLALLYIAAAVVVALEHQVAVWGGTALLLLVVVEVALSVYMIGFVDAAPGGWVFGPVAGAALIALHAWPRAALQSSTSSTATATAGATATSAAAGPPTSAAVPGHVPGMTGADVTAPPHL